MARKVYACAMEQTRYFNIEADEGDEERVMEWLLTHNMQDVDNLTKDYQDEWDERICEIADVNKFHSDFILKKEMN